MAFAKKLPSTARKAPPRHLAEAAGLALLDLAKAPYLFLSGRKRGNMGLGFSI